MEKVAPKAVKKTATNNTSKAVAPKAQKITAGKKATKTETKTVAAVAPAKKTATKTVAPKATAPKKSKKVEEPKAAPQVALAINKMFCGLNLFFADRKFKTEEDSAFMKGELKMRWNRTDSCWYVKFRDKSQLDRVIEYFGDRLWLPEDLDAQVAEVLGSASKTVKKSAPKVSFSTLVRSN